MLKNKDFVATRPPDAVVLRHDYSTCLIYAYGHAGLVDGLISSEFTSSLQHFSC